MNWSMRSVTTKNGTSWPNYASVTPKETLLKSISKVSQRPWATEPKTGVALITVIATPAAINAQRRRMEPRLTASVDGPRENRLAR